MNSAISGIFCAGTKHDEGMGGNPVETQMQARNGSERRYTNDQIAAYVLSFETILSPCYGGSRILLERKFASASLDLDLHKSLLSQTGSSKRFGWLWKGVQRRLQTRAKAHGEDSLPMKQAVVEIGDKWGCKLRNEARSSRFYFDWTHLKGKK